MSYGIALASGSMAPPTTAFALPSVSETMRTQLLSLSATYSWRSGGGTEGGTEGGREGGREEGRDEEREGEREGGREGEREGGRGSGEEPQHQQSSNHSTTVQRSGHKTYETEASVISEACT